MALGWRRHLPDPASLSAGAGGAGGKQRVPVPPEEEGPGSPAPTPRSGRERGGRRVELKPPSSPSASSQSDRPPPTNESAGLPTTNQ